MSGTNDPVVVVANQRAGGIDGLEQAVAVLRKRADTTVVEVAGPGELEAALAGLTGGTRGRRSAEYLIASPADGLEDYYMGIGEAPGGGTGRPSVVGAEALPARVRRVKLAISRELWHKQRVMAHN